MYLRAATAVVLGRTLEILGDRIRAALSRRIRLFEKQTRPPLVARKLQRLRYTRCVVTDYRRSLIQNTSLVVRGDEARAKPHRNDANGSSQKTASPDVHVG
jgi:hypothetical protein